MVDTVGTAATVRFARRCDEREGSETGKGRDRGCSSGTVGRRRARPARSAPGGGWCRRRVPLDHGGLRRRTPAPRQRNDEGVASPSPPEIRGRGRGGFPRHRVHRPGGFGGRAPCGTMTSSESPPNWLRAALADHGGRISAGPPAPPTTRCSTAWRKPAPTLWRAEPGRREANRHGAKPTGPWITGKRRSVASETRSCGPFRPGYRTSPKPSSHCNPSAIWPTTIPTHRSERPTSLRASAGLHDLSAFAIYLLTKLGSV